MKRLELVLPRPLARAERLAMAVDPYPGRRILIGAAPERIRRLADIGRKCLAHVIDEPDEFILGVICMKLFCDGFRIVTIAAHAFRRAEDDLAWLDGMQQRFDADGVLLDEKPVVRNDAIMMYSPYLEEGGANE